MPKDYMLERVQELSRALEAIVAAKKKNPAKALELINDAFTATKFRDKNVFDNFNITELEEFVTREDMDYGSVDTIIDLLFEEAEIKRHELLLAKIHTLITYAAQKEKEEKIFSFKRGFQRERLKKMTHLPS